MDDIFDNLIYIVIALVTFGISALGKKKKKQQKQISKSAENNTPEEKQSPFGFNLERLIKEELGVEDQYEQEYEGPTEKETVVEIIEKPLDFVPEHMLDNKEDIPYSIEYDEHIEIKSEISDSDLTQTSHDEKTILEDFDLQKAIIYSEILNRKEY
jgi:hypothetical protein